MKFDSDLVRGWIAADDVDSLARYLMSGTHHGKPGAPQAVKLGVIGLLQECSAGRRLAWTRRLMKRDEGVARSVACGVVATSWDRDRKGTSRRLRTLAQDADWEVREWAAGGLADVLARDFRGGLAVCDAWTKKGEEASCRAAALALSTRAKQRVASEAVPMLRVIARQMTLDGAYLQENLGPFAIGGGFLSRFPPETLAMLRRESKKPDENTRWNVAMAFTTAVARKYAVDGAKILDAFESDDRKRIARAVSKARKNLSC